MRPDVNVGLLDTGTGTNCDNCDTTDPWRPAQQNRKRATVTDKRQLINEISGISEICPIITAIPCTVYTGNVLSGLAEHLLGLEEMGQKFSLKRV